MSIDEINGRHVGKNYSTDDGNTWVVGGKLVIEEGAKVEGLNSDDSDDSDTIPIASDSVLGGVKVGNGLSVTSDGILSIAPASTTVVGGVKKLPYTEDFEDVNFSGFESHFNQFLAALREAGIMEEAE